ncbi:MAG TPA: MlaD family protein [bacterium]|jgi:phospholipid/cholesterol/gamma-HCH transport system substrate-binding protein
MRETDPRFVHLEWKVGVFLVFAAALVVVVVVGAGVQQGLFRAKAQLYLSAASGTGLRQGMAVKLQGFTIGRLTHHTLRDVSRVEGTIAIDRRYLHWLRADSRANLVPEGMLGEMAIDLTPGSAGAPPLAEGDHLSLDRKAGLADLLAEVDTVRALLADLRQGGILGTLRNLGQISTEMLASGAHLEQVLDRVEETAAHMDRLIAQTEGTVAHTDRTVAHTNDLLDAMETTTQRVARMATGLEEKLPTLIARTDQLLARLETTATALADASRNAPELVRQTEALLDQTRAVLTDTRAVLAAIGDIWPIRSHLKNKSTP